MYAVFEDGSRQYRVSEGDVVQVDYRTAEVGTRLEFNRVLLYQDSQAGPEPRIGQPTLEGARVLADVVDHPSIKLYIQHFRRRKNSRRLRGHRQYYTAVQIRHILLAGMEPPAPVSETAAAPPQQAPSPPAPESTAAPAPQTTTAPSPEAPPQPAPQAAPPPAPEASTPPSGQASSQPEPQPQPQAPPATAPEGQAPQPPA